MECELCRKILTPTEIVDGTGMCILCELKYLRAYKKREEEHLKKLIGSPVWNKYIRKSPVHGNGCVLNSI
jgi:hypothetical protein